MIRLGLSYLRVPTWCPFRLQFYFNGHSLLSALLTQKGIGFQKLENAFLSVADFSSANRIAERIDLRKIHAKLDRIAQDCSLLRILLRGEFTISGFTSKMLKGLLPGKNTGQVGRLLKRLRVHGLIKRIGKRYKYYVTHLGLWVACTALKLRELFMLPQLSLAPVVVRKASKDAKK